jgi:hypothetical protein
MPISDDELDSFKKLTDHFQSRKNRAAERLAQSTHPEWCFAIVGLETSLESFRFGDSLVFRKVIEPPGEIELAAALRNQHLFGAVGRYSRLITHEIAIQIRKETEDQFPFTVAWWIVSAIRVKTLAEFLVPVAADHSWSVIAALGGRECHVRFVEDVPQSQRVDASIAVSQADFEWVTDRLDAFVKMLEVPRFRLAVDALTTHQHLIRPRMMVASLWAGFEALIGVQFEVSFRLALSIASVLEPRGADRVDLYRKAKKLYGIRSKAVHGAAMKDEDLLSHVGDVRKLLSRLLCSMIDAGAVLSEDEIERRILE